MRAARCRSAWIGALQGCLGRGGTGQQWNCGGNVRLSNLSTRLHAGQRGAWQGKDLGLARPSIGQPAGIHMIAKGAWIARQRARPGALPTAAAPGAASGGETTSLALASLRGCCRMLKGQAFPHVTAHCFASKCVGRAVHRMRAARARHCTTESPRLLATPLSRPDAIAAPALLQLHEEPAIATAAAIPLPPCCMPALRCGGSHVQRRAVGHERKAARERASGDASA